MNHSELLKSPNSTTLEVEGKQFIFDMTREGLKSILDDQNNGNEFRLCGDGEDGEKSFSLGELRKDSRNHLEDIF